MDRHAWNEPETSAGSALRAIRRANNQPVFDRRQTLPAEQGFLASVLKDCRIYDPGRNAGLQQRVLIDQAINDPSIQKVWQKKDALTPSIVVEKRDGSVETYMPNGVKITTSRRFKLTEFPRSVNAKVASIREYDDGKVESLYRNGSTLVTPARSDKSYKYSPDGTTAEIHKDGTVIVSMLDKTKIILKPDGTKTTINSRGVEIVQNPNGETVLTRPDRVERDGTKVWHKDDGTEVRETSDGRRICIFPERVDPAVRETIDFSTGDRVAVMRSGSMIHFRNDGTIRTLMCE